MAIELNANQPGVLQLKGILGFDQADQTIRTGQRWLSQQPAGSVTIDLSDLQEPSTLTLAVLMQWFRSARSDQSLSLVNVPDKLAAIIGASNLQVLLQ